MKIAFHGAARTVTGSKHLLTLKNGKKILLDCGLFQGMGRETDLLNKSFGFDASAIDVMVLSHAHIDHSGLIPKLIKEGFKGKIYCTPATNDLTKILLLDSAEIQRDDVRFINKKRKIKGDPPIEPLYEVNDAMNSFEHLEAVPYRSWQKIEEGVEVMFTDAGHIIGSAAVSLKITDGGQTFRITFSGDVGRYRDIILKSPEEFPQADFILLESTYGNSLHDEHTPTAAALLHWITKTCLEKKGKLIIPAFSVGRTQELLYTINGLELANQWPGIPVYVDSPLSQEATQVVKSHPEGFNKELRKVLESDEDPFAFKGLHFIKDVEESKALNYRNDPCVIISASGMADNGRVKHHIANNIQNSKNTILMVGYCEPNSLGARLMGGQKEVRIYGTNYEVNAEIGSMRSMSAHGDYDDLLQFLACQDKKMIRKLFLVHGEYDVQQDFRNRLVRKGFADVEIPAMHYEIGLTLE